ncbi:MULTISPECIES: sensor histidine kinase [unclassified Luteococcus]|uniref:sensor histidine kinase n=1 Tax=unclassified Luteococcus TaxID=2639923 RepID=UPI00313E7209
MRTADVATPTAVAPLPTMRIWQGRRGVLLRLGLLLLLAWTMRSWAFSGSSPDDGRNPGGYAVGVLTVALLLFRPAWSTPALMVMLLLDDPARGFVGWQPDILIGWALVRLPRAGARSAWREAAGVVAAFEAWVLINNGGRVDWLHLLLSLFLLGLLGLVVLVQRRRLEQVAREGSQRRRLQSELSQTRQRERSRLADELQRTLTDRLARMRSLLASPTPDVESRLAVLERLDDGARVALAELRLVMAVLTDQSPDPARQAVAELVPATNLRNTLDAVNDRLEPLGVTVTAPTGLAELPSSTQEALSHALREVAVPLLRSTREPARARAEIQLGEDHVTLSVELTDRVAVGSRALDVRVRLLGGSLSRERSSAGLAPDGSLVRVTLPLSAARPRARRRIPLALVARILLGGLLLVALLDNSRPGWGPILVNVALLALLVSRRWGLPLALLAGCWTLGSDTGIDGLVLVGALPLYYCRDSAGVQRILWTAIGCWLGLALMVHPQPSRLLDNVTVLLLFWLLALAIRSDWLTIERERLLTSRLLARCRRVENEVRSGLARELHDVVAHQLSIVTLQIMGHRHSRDAAELDVVLERVRTATARAEVELASLGRVMRTGEAVEDLPPGLRIPQLVEELEAAGHPVSVQLAPDLDDLPQAQRHTMVRFVQEGTTNALRHAPDGCQVRLACLREGDHLRLEMTNPTSRQNSRLAHLSLGRGLQGLTDRVHLLGGRLQAGPDSGGWRLAAELPLD